MNVMHLHNQSINFSSYIFLQREIPRQHPQEAPSTTIATKNSTSCYCNLFVLTVPTSSFCISLPCTRLRITCAKKVSQYSQHHHLVSEARPCTPNHAGMALMVGVEIRSTCGPKHFYHEAMGAHRASWKCNRSSLILMYGTTFPMAAGS
jgi:hypothetical protein